MKLEIEVPEVTCARCNTKAAALPTALRRTADGGTVVDSAGNSWQAQGATLPTGWSPAPTDTTKVLCPFCAVAVAKGIENLLKPPAPEAPIKTAATSIPIKAPEPVVGRIMQATPTPAQAAARVTGGAHIYSNPVQRPEPVVSASPTIVQPSAISRPIAPATPQHAPQPNAVVVGPPKIRAPIAPAERGSNVVVQSNSQFPQPKVQNVQPVPSRGEVARTREVAVHGNEEVEPVQPPTVLPVIRGVGV